MKKLQINIDEMLLNLSTKNELNRKDLSYSCNAYKIVTNGVLLWFQREKQLPH